MLVAVVVMAMVVMAMVVMAVPMVIVTVPVIVVIVLMVVMAVAVIVMIVMPRIGNRIDAVCDCDEWSPRCRKASIRRIDSSPRRATRL